MDFHRFSHHDEFCPAPQCSFNAIQCSNLSISFPIGDSGPHAIVQTGHLITVSVHQIKVSILDLLDHTDYPLFPDGTWPATQFSSTFSCPGRFIPSRNKVWCPKILPGPSVTSRVCYVSNVYQFAILSIAHVRMYNSVVMVTCAA